MKLLVSADFDFKSLLTLPKTKGDYVLKVWTSEPNGVTDENTENDALDVTITVAEGLQQRLVLLEHFTNTGCGPCAAQNPDLEALIAKDGNDKKVLHITYHGNYPSAEDPFYLANVEHNGGRMQYYGISAFPSVIISGQKNTGPSSVTQDDINREYYRPGLCSVEGGYQFMPTTLEIGVELKNTQDFTGRNITMNIIVMESHEYDEAPGSNGEKVFPNVMRSMLTDVTGMELKNLGLDEKNNYRLTYQLPDDMNDDKVKLAYFVQDQDTKEILMADYLAPATGVEDDETYIKTGLWPNPTSDVLNIKSAERIKSVELINMNGKLVKSEVINNQYGYLSLAGLSEGVYLVKLYIEDSVIVKQIIKK
jgi:thiol-disulfide isomerase/thioredoxin